MARPQGLISSPFASLSPLFFFSLLIFFVSFVLGLWNRSLLVSYALPYASTELVIARAVTILEEGMDLELIREDPDPDFLVKRGVKRGIARQVVRDIDY